MNVVAAVSRLIYFRFTIPFRKTLQESEGLGVFSIQMVPETLAHLCYLLMDEDGYQDRKRGTSLLIPFSVF